MKPADYAMAHHKIDDRLSRAVELGDLRVKDPLTLTPIPILLAKHFASRSSSSRIYASTRHDTVSRQLIKAPGISRKNFRGKCVNARYRLDDQSQRRASSLEAAQTLAGSGPCRNTAFRVCKAPSPSE